jgi:FkbM family methyltransferase
MKALRFLFDHILVPAANVFAKPCRYKVQVVPEEAIFHVDLKYDSADKNIITNLPEQTASCLRINFGKNRADFFDFMTKYKENAKYIDSVYNLLSDEESRKTYFNIIKFRLTYWLSRTKPSLSPSLTLKEPKYPVPAVEGRSHFVKTAIRQVYFNSQYEIPGIAEADKGDNVIDAGAFYGDTALYFSSAVGSGGTVYAFEPNKNIAGALARNIQKNNRSNIIVVEKGVSDRAASVKLINDGAASRIADDSSGKNSSDILDIETITIDEFADQISPKQINFIKLDVEEHERLALAGAQNVIKKYKPKLAISIYHTNSDVFELPLLIHDLNPGYAFYVRHTSHNWHDTVLFCVQR